MRSCAIDRALKPLQKLSQRDQSRSYAQETLL